jgi:hypothetical protein
MHPCLVFILSSLWSVVLKEFQLSGVKPSVESSVPHAFGPNAQNTKQLRQTVLRFIKISHAKPESCVRAFSFSKIPTDKIAITGRMSKLKGTIEPGRPGIGG